jgi:hypothetical protein
MFGCLSHRTDFKLSIINKTAGDAKVEVHDLIKSQ